jgi:hypothetical protein
MTDAQVQQNDDAYLMLVSDMGTKAAYEAGEAMRRVAMLMPDSRQGLGVTIIGLGELVAGMMYALHELVKHGMEREVGEGAALVVVGKVLEGLANSDKELAFSVAEKLPQLILDVVAEIRGQLG